MTDLNEETAPVLYSLLKEAHSEGVKAGEETGYEEGRVAGWEEALELIEVDIPQDRAHIIVRLQAVVRDMRAETARID